MADEFISQRSLELLAQILVKHIQQEFDLKHMSGNLANTIELIAEKDSVKVIIPAQTYNMLLYQTKGVVVHTSHGSYASKLDTTGSEFYVYPYGGRKGSFKVSPHNHRGFVDKVIQEAIEEWGATRGEFIANKVG